MSLYSVLRAVDPRVAQQFKIGILCAEQHSIVVKKVDEIINFP